MPENSSSQSEPSRTVKTLGGEARKDIKRARAALESADWQKVDEKATFYLAEAQVLATLDLADAIRNTGGLEAPTTPATSGSGALSDE